MSSISGGRAPAEATDRATHRGALIGAVAVLLWSIAELANLAVKHTTGPELYGVLTAALASGAAVANLAILRAERPRAIAMLAVLAVWLIVALAGIAGTVAHVVGPPIGEGPIDPRPRPAAAPLVFTLLGFLGAATLALGQRATLRNLRNPWKE
jgi:hypothetical protein